MGESVQFQLMGEFICVVGKIRWLTFDQAAEFTKWLIHIAIVARLGFAKGSLSLLALYSSGCSAGALFPTSSVVPPGLLGCNVDAVHSGVRIEGVSIAIAIANSVTIAAILLMGNVFGLLSYMVMLMSGGCCSVIVVGASRCIFDTPRGKCFVYRMLCGDLPLCRVV